MRQKLHKSTRLPPCPFTARGWLAAPPIYGADVGCGRKEANHSDTVERGHDSNAAKDDRSTTRSWPVHLDNAVLHLWLQQNHVHCKEGFLPSITIAFVTGLVLAVARVAKNWLDGRSAFALTGYMQGPKPENTSDRCLGEMN